MRKTLITLGFLFLLIGVALYAQTPVKLSKDSAGNAILASNASELTHGAVAPTWTSVVGLVQMGRAATSLPSAVSDSQPVAPLRNVYGAQGTFPMATAIGGDDPCYIATTASTNAFNCKASAGTVYELSAVNTTATLYYLRIYNSAASPTCSSSTGFVESIPIPASTSGAGIVRTYPVGRNYSAGISGCVTLNAANNDNNAAVSGIYITFGYR